MDPATLEAMRDWIADCVWGDLDSEYGVEDLSDAEVIDGVRRHYEGGIDQFLRDGSALDRAEVQS